MRIGLMRVSLLTPMLLALIFVTAGNAFGDEIDPSIFYRITAKHSGRCLAVAGGMRSLTNGNRVIQWDCIESEDNQKWQIIPVGNGFYKILAKHSGKALDVFGGIFSFGNGTAVKQWDYYGNANQMWKLVRDAQGCYTISARHSGKSLSVEGGPGATGNGSNVQQLDDVGGANQRWILAPIPTAAWAAMTRFDPSRHGFLFANTFINDLGSGLKSDGLCGGMMYAALDYYLAGAHTPGIAYRPSIGTPLQMYLYNRQTTQITSNLDRFADMILSVGPLADKKGYFERGIKEETLREIRTRIDAGTPVVLALQNANDALGHSVLAIGYDMGRYRGDLGAHPEDLSIYVYDPNHPGETRILTPDVVHQRYVYRHNPSLAADSQASWLTYFVDTRYRNTAAPAIFEPNLGGPDGLIRELRLTIRTGGDELVGGNDEVQATVKFDGRESQIFANINHRMRWIAGYEQTISLPLASPVRLADIRGIDLTKTSRATIAGVDVWDLDMVCVKAYGGGVMDRQLLRREGTPLMRFTDRLNTFSTEFPR